jgi:NADH:ubiquinone oxidoreductase subunit 5 (subunit L)/multisubunit Na+/H+ antiporter MnhA subunit
MGEVIQKNSSNELLSYNEISLWFATMCIFFLLLGLVVKSTQFLFHVWLPNTMEVA